jgi:cell division protein ZapA
VSPEPASAQITLQILDREYLVSCSPDQRAALLDAAAYLDGRLRTARDSSETGTDAMTIRVALCLAGELLQLKSREAKLESEVQGQLRSLRERLEDALEKGSRVPL